MSPSKVTSVFYAEISHLSKNSAEAFYYASEITQSSWATRVFFLSDYSNSTSMINWANINFFVMLMLGYTKWEDWYLTIITNSIVLKAVPKLSTIYWNWAEYYYVSRVILTCEVSGVYLMSFTSITSEYGEEHHDIFTASWVILKMCLIQKEHYRLVLTNNI